VTLAFIGHGNVGGALAHRLQGLGHRVVIAASEAGSDSLAQLRARNPGILAAPIVDAVRGADVVFLATPFAVTADVLGSIAAELAGKVVVDCTNPVGPGLSHGLRSEQSGSQLLQARVPAEHVVKAFSIYGFENLEDNAFPGVGVKPVMMYCGDDAAAKRVVGGLIEALGWEPLDVGGLVQALHLEHLTLLWIRMVRAGGAPPRLTWAVLR
jgi:predicted dinucleotide-binding enzyme